MGIATSQPPDHSLDDGEHETAQLVIDAMNMAIAPRKPESVMHHSDQGSHYTSLAFGQRCKELGVRRSMGSAGDSSDNAMYERFCDTLACEVLDHRKFPTKAEACVACFEFIEDWHNPSPRLRRVSIAKG